MYRTLFLLISVFNLHILNCFSENVKTDENYDQPYVTNRLYRRFSSPVSFKDKSAILANNLLFNKLDRDFNLELLGNSSQNYSKCVNDILYTFESLSNMSNMWAWRLLDSFGKPPESGILIGNTKWIGEYNECIDVYAPPKSPGSTTGNFNGQYCTMTYTLPLLNTSLPLTIGICLPDSCTPQDLQAEILQILFKAGRFPVSDDSLSSFTPPVSITCQQKEKPWTAGAISVIVLLCIFSAFALMGSSITAVKYFMKLIQEHQMPTLIINTSSEGQVIQNPDDAAQKNIDSDAVFLLPSQESNSFLENCDAFLNCFCVFTNGAKLLNTDSSEGQLLCIHGIRFLSMSWVILGHSYSFGYLETRNMAEVMKMIDNFPFQAIMQGYFSVDSFFVLSGFLLCYLSMKEFSKTKGSVNWLYFYIHRYIRLTPIYMIVLGFVASVYFYLGSGPFWPSTDHDANCKKNWWWNLLYINNFNPQNEMCMGWSWYLANDMQFFAISPIFLITLWKRPQFGYGLLSLFLAASMISCFYITYHYDLMVGTVGIDLVGGNALQVIAKFMIFFDKVYIKPYTRIGPYLVGIFAGYIFYKHKTSNRPKLHWISLCIGWIVASSVTLTCVYGLYHAHPSLIARSFYSALSRTLYGLGLSWVIYVCLTNQSNVINSILSFKLFIPLSRLTYSAYLIHPIILMVYSSSLKTTLEFSHPTMVVIYLGIMVISYALALPVSLILESPIVSLEKLIRKKFSKT